MTPADPTHDAAPIDWGDFQFFLAVAEGGSIAEAARRLGVNHSTVLRRIARLESALACRLFDRLPGGYALTPRGNALAARLAGLSEQVDSVQRQLNGLDPAIEGVIRISTSDMVAESLLMPLLAQFRGRHPLVQLQLVMNDSLSMLLQRRCDIAVHAAAQAPEGFAARRVGQIDWVVCGSQAYLDRTGHELPLAQHRRVAVEATLPAQRLEPLHPAAEPERISLRIDSLLGAADAVAAGLGLAVLPRTLLQARPQLVALDRAEPERNEALWVLMHPDVQHTARMAALFDFLCDHLGRARPRPHRPR